MPISDFFSETESSLKMLRKLNVRWSIFTSHSVFISFLLCIILFVFCKMAHLTPVCEWKENQVVCNCKKRIFGMCFHGLIRSCNSVCCTRMVWQLVLKFGEDWSSISYCFTYPSMLNLMSVLMGVGGQMAKFNIEV